MNSRDAATQLIHAYEDGSDLMHGHYAVGQFIASLGGYYRMTATPAENALYLCALLLRKHKLDVGDKP